MSVANKLDDLEKFANDQLEKVIMPFWRKYTIDNVNQGFYGQVNLDLTPDFNAEKGLILNARLLWTFSSVYGKFHDPRDIELANRAYAYLKDFFYDNEYSGYYWSLNPDGSPADTKKQIYAEAFAIYGFSEYYKVNSDAHVLQDAVDLFNLIEKYSFDPLENGYIEACDRSWNELADLRLSAKDMNEKKSMNTHLHILEAYTNLYRIWPDEVLAQKLENLIFVFKNHIVNKQDHHLNLFFDEHWNSRSNLISYGHDIEASWLMYEAALLLGKKVVIEDIKVTCLKVADAALKGFRSPGAFIYEDDRDGKHEDHLVEWWPQAEGIVGCMNAYALRGDEPLVEKALLLAKFIDNYIVDHENGEWFFRVDLEGKPVRSYEKAGFWKCPYHNARACLEILQRVEELNS